MLVSPYIVGILGGLTYANGTGGDGLGAVAGTSCKTIYACGTNLSLTSSLPRQPPLHAPMDQSQMLYSSQCTFKIVCLIDILQGSISAECQCINMRFNHGRGFPISLWA